MVLLLDLPPMMMDGNFQPQKLVVAVVVIAVVAVFVNVAVAIITIICYIPFIAFAYMPIFASSTYSLVICTMEIKFPNSFVIRFQYLSVCMFVGACSCRV